MKAICGVSTFSTLTSRFSRAPPSESTTCFTASGRVRTPLFANVENATATSSGVTSAAPSANDGTAGRTLNAKTVRDIPHPFNAYIARDSRRGRVQRLLERAAKGDRAKILVVIVAGLPLLPVVAPLERRILHHGRRRKLFATLTTRHEGRQINKRLKDRAWLPLCLEDTIELGLLIAPAANHCLNFTGLRSEHDDCALEIIFLALSS